MKYLIVNADDFGFSEQINAGICEAFANGVVTDSSVLVRSPYAEQALCMAREIGMPVGIHLDFVTDFVSSCSSHFGPHGSLVEILFEREFQRCCTAALTADQLICIENEMRAQIELFRAITGCLPSHLDYHFGLHYFPEVMSVYVTTAEEYALPIRWGCQYAGENPYNLAPNLFCDRFRGLETGSLQLFLDLVQQHWDQVMEFICHPGYFTPGVFADSYNREREYELKALTSQNLKQQLKDMGIQLISYDWLKNSITEEKRMRGYIK
jgi:chitin disaccharide deacetylase